MTFLHRIESHPQKGMDCRLPQHIEMWWEKQRSHSHQWDSKVKEILSFIWSRAVDSLWQRDDYQLVINPLSLSLWMTIKAGAIWTVPNNKNQELFVPFHFSFVASCLIAVCRSTTSADNAQGGGDWMLIVSGISRLRNIESKDKVDKDIYMTYVNNVGGIERWICISIKKMEGRNLRFRKLREKNTDYSIWLNVIMYVFRLRYIIRH